MSVASSAASTISVRFQGETMSLEDATRKAIRDIQDMFNQLEASLIQLAQASDQQVDDEEDFQLCVAAEERAEDLVDGMKYLLDELPEIAAEIRGDPPSKAARTWWAERKRVRKHARLELQAKRKAAAEAEAQARRALTLAAESKTA